MSTPLRVGIAGLGTVGAGVVKAIRTNGDLLTKRCGRPIEIAAVSARDRAKDRGVSIDGLTWHDDPLALASDADVDVVVELIGGEAGVAKQLAEDSFDGGKAFVTANKALIALHGVDLSARANAAGLALRFEAAVAGGIPVIKGISEGLAGNRLSRAYGILNGTCNYILSVMEDTGRSFDDVLAEAQELGYAEADPSFDIDGIDTAHKLAILSSVAFGTQIDYAGVYVEGLRHITALDLEYAAELGYRVKLLGIANLSERGLEQRVHPCMVSLETPIAHVMGVDNAVVSEGDLVGRCVYEGPGAGEGPTASAVVADLVDIARGNTHPILNGGPGHNQPTAVPMADHSGRYYLRLNVVDRPGVIAGITAVFRDEDVSMESLLQRGRAPDEAVTVVMTTHETVEAKMLRSLSQIAKLDFTTEKPEMIRIENL